MAVFQDIHSCSKLSLEETPYVIRLTYCNHKTFYKKSNPHIWATWSSKGFRIHQQIAEISGVWKLPFSCGEGPFCLKQAARESLCPLRRRGGGRTVVRGEPENYTRNSFSVARAHTILIMDV